MEGKKGLKITISPDKMAAFLTLPEGGAWDVWEIRRALNANGVVFGISDAAIRSCILGERNQPRQVAWGLSPPETKQEVKPKLVFKYGHSKGKPPNTFAVNPRFREEWRKLTARGFVREKSVLAFVQNADRCAFGIAVTGEKVLYAGGEPMLTHMNNARVSEDGRYIVAAKSGIPYVEPDGVGVLCSVTIKGDIGPETGDIVFPGDLTVEGDVMKGFKVSTWGSLVVTGNLYGSATAANSITVKGGIIAPGEFVSAGESIIARYCENSVLSALGNVVIADAVMHSIVETEQAVICSQDEGRIVGGLIVARCGVSTHTAGSPMGVPTVCQIGASPKLRKRYETLKQQLASVRAELQKIKHAGLRRRGQPGREFDNLRLQRMRTFYEDREKELSELLANVGDTIAACKQGYFTAVQVLPGTRVVLGMDEISFDYPEQGVRIGGETGEAD